jgi:iron complex outermembrane receptor protein
MKPWSLQFHIGFWAFLTGAWQSSSFAQTVPPQAGNTATEQSTATLNEIIVTARKREERDLDVPIAMTALGSAQLARYGVQDLEDLAALTPNLNISVNFGALGGGITLRGVGASALNAATDQAVVLNFDGVSLANGSAVRFSQFDVDRMEVLQGPQSLYFGKNTTAGVISIISADPTGEPYAMARVGYEFQSEDLLTETVLSGPLVGDVLTGRIAFYRSDMQGYFYNPLAHYSGTPPAALMAMYGPLLSPEFPRSPNSDDTGGRVTLKFAPNDNLTVRLKGTYTEQVGSASNQSAHLFGCPSGVPAPGSPTNIPGVGDCNVDRNSIPLGQNPNSQEGGSALFGNGQPYSDQWQYLLVGDVDAKIANGLTLSSVTGFYNLQLLDAENSTSSPYPGIGGANDVEQSDLTQEVRVTSDFDAPLNGLLGAYYDRGHFYSNTAVTILQIEQPQAIYRIPSRTYAGFGQLTYDLIGKELQLSAGGRYTSERKDLSLYSRALNAYVTDLAVNSITSNNFTPEVVLT